MFRQRVSRVLALMAAGLVAGCASKSEDISASYVSPMLYDSYTCPQLQEEAARVSHHAAEVAGVQDKKASNDAVATGVGVVVFLPALLFLKGDGQTAAEVARLKGEVDAIEQTSIKKHCGLSFRQS